MRSEARSGGVYWEGGDPSGKSSSCSQARGAAAEIVVFPHAYVMQALVRLRRRRISIPNCALLRGTTDGRVVWVDEEVEVAHLEETRRLSPRFDW